ncbi:MAG: exosortase A [Pseudomonadota bacterium]
MPPAAETAYAASLETPAPIDGRTLHGRAIALYLGFIIAVLIFFAPTAMHMIRVWGQSATYQYGYLVAPMAVAMLALDRRRLLSLAPKRSALGAAGVVFASAMWLAAHAAGVAIAEQVALISMIVAGALASYGRAIFSIASFPLAFLFFMVPFGESFIAPFQTITVGAIMASLAAAGMPASADGFFITTAAGDFHVIAECAGLRFFIAAIMVAGFFGRLHFGAWRQTLAFMALAGVFAIAANGLRASLMVVIATATNKQLAVGDNHLFLGWISYAIAFALLLWIGRRMARDTQPLQRTASSHGMRAEKGSGDWIAASLILAPIIATLYAHAIVDRTPSITSVPAFPMMAEWTSDAPDRWAPAFTGADRKAFSSAAHGDATITLAAGGYTHDRPGAEIVHHSNRSFNGQSWKHIGQSKHEGAVFNLIYGPKGERRAATTLYWLGDDYYRSPLQMKLAQFRLKLIGVNPAGGVIIASAPYADDPEMAIAAIDDYLALHVIDTKKARD